MEYNPIQASNSTTQTPLILTVEQGEYPLGRHLDILEDPGGDEYQMQREQWDDANNTVALEPGVVVPYERNTYTIAKMRQAGVQESARPAGDRCHGARRPGFTVAFTSLV